jgi:hypothetical protein
MPNDMSSICGDCGVDTKVLPARTVLGFRTFRCSACGKATVLPLTTSYRSVYWLIVIIGVFSIAERSLGLVWGLPLAVAGIALLRDQKLRKPRG